jgi:hypothetical protein
MAAARQLAALLFKERRINAYIFSRALSATVLMAVTAYRRAYGNILGDRRGNERKSKRTVGKHNRVPCRQFDGRHDILVHLHLGGRSDLYLYDSRFSQKYDSQQPKRKYDSRQILFGFARHNGYARGGVLGYLNR